MASVCRTVLRMTVRGWVLEAGLVFVLYAAWTKTLPFLWRQAPDYSSASAYPYVYGRFGPGFIRGISRGLLVWLTVLTVMLVLMPLDALAHPGDTVHLVRSIVWGLEGLLIVVAASTSVLGRPKALVPPRLRRGRTSL